MMRRTASGDSQRAEQAAIDMLARLVAFDTTSFRSNLALIDWMEELLRDLGVEARRVVSEDGAKANLYATLGPNVTGGVVLSGHTDVVPVAGQSWTSDPFTLVEREGRLYGRGTCDMKGFIACALAAAPLFAQQGKLRRPVHFAWSYDEEVGCIGAPAMIAEMARLVPPPAAVIVGEPSNMKAVHSHKGSMVHTVSVKGHEAHSSLTHLGVSANMIAVQLMSLLADIAGRLEENADPASRFEPPHATLTIGQMQGGTAANILAGECSFVFDLRCPPGLDGETILAPFFAEAQRLDAQARSRFSGCGVTITRRSAVPAFAAEPDGAAEALVRHISGDNGPPLVVPYASEAGQFQQAEFSTVICGPGSIEQAHQPDEFIECEQMRAGVRFMERLADLLGD